MTARCLLLVGLVCLAVPPSASQTGESIGNFTDELLNRSPFSSETPPGQPTEVTVNIFINSLSKINEVDMEYTLNIFFRQEWKDPRLAFTRYNHSLTLNYNQYSRLWVPDAFFKNEKEAKFHDVTVPNRLITIAPDGTVLFSQRLSLTLSCDMHLARYPLDNQTCPIQLETYGYTTKDLVFRWRDEDPVQIKEDLVLPEFFLHGVLLGDCTADYITGAFSCIYATLGLDRQFAYYLIQTYIPSMLVVMLSWVSFWIDMHAVPARITLGLLTVLTMTTQSSGVSQRLPRVSYVKAIDVWMTTCLAFVFGGLIEYSIVNVLARKHESKMKKKKEKASKEVMKSSTDELKISYVTINEKGNGSVQDDIDEQVRRDMSVGTTPNNPRSKPIWWKKVWTNQALMVDVISRILFPVVFAVFNVVYWITYG